MQLARDLQAVLVLAFGPVRSFLDSVRERPCNLPPCVWLHACCTDSAPEALKMNRCDKQADLWRAGVIFFTLVQGYPPFHGKPLDRKMPTSTDSPCPEWTMSCCDQIGMKDSSNRSAWRERDDLLIMLKRRLGLCVGALVVFSLFSFPASLSCLQVDTTRAT